MPEMTRIPVNQLKPAMLIDQIFMISQPQLRTTSRGDYYIAAFLSDKTGKLNGRMWQATEAIFQSLPAEGFVLVTGRTENYQSSLQLVINTVQPVPMEQVKINDFMPSTDKDIAEMWNQTLAVLDTIENPHYKKLLVEFLKDKELMGKFRMAPAAISLHHAYVGGLLEHTLSLLQLGQGVMDHYPQLDRDLVIMGLFLHDIGKTSELDYNISFKYSDQGHLLGHLVKGVMLIEQKVAQIDAQAATEQEKFPRTLADCLEHLILSHHGTREFGAPVLPSMSEAFVLHFLDNLDSKVALTCAEIAKDNNESNWTNYIRSLETPLFKVRTADIK